MRPGVLYTKRQRTRELYHVGNRKLIELVRERGLLYDLGDLIMIIKIVTRKQFSKKNIKFSLIFSFAVNWVQPVYPFSFSLGHLQTPQSNASSSSEELSENLFHAQYLEQNWNADNSSPLVCPRNSKKERRTSNVELGTPDRLLSARALIE